MEPESKEEIKSKSEFEKLESLAEQDSKKPIEFESKEIRFRDSEELSLKSISGEVLMPIGSGDPKLSITMFDSKLSLDKFEHFSEDEPTKKISEVPNLKIIEIDKQDSKSHHSGLKSSEVMADYSSLSQYETSGLKNCRLDSLSIEEAKESKDKIIKKLEQTDNPLKYEAEEEQNFEVFNTKTLILNQDDENFIKEKTEQDLDSLKNDNSAQTDQILLYIPIVNELCLDSNKIEETVSIYPNIDTKFKENIIEKIKLEDAEHKGIVLGCKNSDIKSEEELFEETEFDSNSSASDDDEIKKLEDEIKKLENEIKNFEKPTKEIKNSEFEGEHIKEISEELQMQETKVIRECKDQESKENDLEKILEKKIPKDTSLENTEMKYLKSERKSLNPYSLKQTINEEITNNKNSGKSYKDKVSSEQVITEVQDLKQLESDFSELETDFRITNIFVSEYDTSKTFKIHKLFIKEGAINELKNYLPDTAQLIAAYGITSVIKKLIEKVFSRKIYEFPSKEGVYLFYNPKEPIGVLALITPYEELFINSPIEDSNRFVVIIRILTDLCHKIVACISDEIINNWFYEDNGESNPYLPKIHNPVDVKCETVNIEESRYDYLNVGNQPIFNGDRYLPNDNLNIIYAFKFKKISQVKKNIGEKRLNEFPNELLVINSTDQFYVVTSNFFIELKFCAFDSNKVFCGLKENFLEKIRKKSDLQKKSVKIFEDLLLKDFEFIKPIVTIESFFKDINLKEEYKNQFSKLIVKLEETLTFRDKNYAKYIENYHISYCQNTLDFERLVDNLFCDINMDFNQKEVKSSWFFSDPINKEKSNLAKGLKKNNKMNGDDFIKYFAKSLKSIFCNPNGKLLKTRAKEFFDFYMKELQEINKSFLKSCESDLQIIKNSLLGKQFIVEKSEHKLGLRDSKLYCSFDNPKRLFREFIDEEDFKVNQIIGLESNTYFIFFSNIKKSLTHVIRFNPILKSKIDDYEKCLDIPDFDVMLAWGSSSQKVIMFQNTNKIATFSSLDCGKYLQQGLPIDIYSKVEKIKASFFMKKSNKLFVIDNKGLLYCNNLGETDSEINTVDSNIISNSSKLQEPLKPLTGSKFLGINISEDENIIFLQTEVYIECFDKYFKRTQVIPITETFISFKSNLVESICFLLTECKNSEMQCVKVTVPKIETV